MSQQALISISLVGGVVFGFLVAWFSYRADRLNIYTRGKSEGAEERIQLQERINSKEERILEYTKMKDEALAAAGSLREENAVLKGEQMDIDDRMEEFRMQILTLQADNNGLRSSLAGAEVRLEESRRLGQEAQQHLEEKFRTLSAEVLQANNQAFAQLAAAALEKLQAGTGNAPTLELESIRNIVSPMQTSLDKVSLFVNRLERDKEETYTALTQQMGTLLNGQSQLRQETIGLTRAIRSAASTLESGVVASARILTQLGSLEPVEPVPHGLRALDHATLDPASNPGPVPQEEAVLG